MKLNRLASTTQQHSPDAIERARHVAGQSVRRVEALEGVEGDRQRSLQQEIAEFDARPSGRLLATNACCKGRARLPLN